MTSIERFGAGLVATMVVMGGCAMSSVDAPNVDVVDRADGSANVRAICDEELATSANGMVAGDYWF